MTSISAWPVTNAGRYPERPLAPCTVPLAIALPHSAPDNEALTTAGEAERAIAHARQALAVCHATKSTRLIRALRRAHTRMRDTWPTHAPVHELGDELHPLGSGR
jgi:replication-associated recombination protein RarA